MTEFPVTVVTPDGLEYEGMAEEIIVRTTTGDLGIQAGHIPCVAPLGMGQAMFIIDGQRRYAACIGGLVSMLAGAVYIAATIFEWADDIDASRAEASEKRAQAVLQSKDATDTDIQLARARLKRALIRKSVANRK